MRKANTAGTGSRPPLRVAAVSDRKAFDAFLRVPFRVFRGDPN
jgi:hypothetical protein